MNENNEFVVISKDELIKIIEEAADRAAKKVNENYEKDNKRQKNKKLHNTHLLLKHYRAFKESVTQSVYSIRQMDPSEEDVKDILEFMMGKDNDSMIVESIKNSALRTAIMVSHISKMLTVYCDYCELSGEKEKRRYDVIECMFIADHPQNAKELSQKHGVSKVTIYDDVKVAEEALTALLFGVDGMAL